MSLTGDPVEEVRVAREILRTLELAPRGPRVISCPTCGRTRGRSGGAGPGGGAAAWRSPVWTSRWRSWGASSTGPARPGRPTSASPAARAREWSSRRGRPVRKVPQAELVDALFEEIARRSPEHQHLTQAAEPAVHGARAC